MARAEPETMSHAEQDAPAVGPESPAGAPSAAASLLLGAATGGRGARGFTRGLPRLSNAGVQALARAALARETAAPAAEFTTADEVVSALVRESQDEVAAARRHRDARVPVPRQGRHRRHAERLLAHRAARRLPAPRGHGRVPARGHRQAAAARRGARLAPPPPRLARDVRDRAPRRPRPAQGDRPRGLPGLARDGGRRGDPAARDRGLQEAQPVGAGPARRLRGWRHVAVRERGHRAREAAEGQQEGHSRRPRRSTSSCTTRRGSRAACPRRPSCGSST